MQMLPFFLVSFKLVSQREINSDGGEPIQRLNRIKACMTPNGMSQCAVSK